MRNLLIIYHFLFYVASISSAKSLIKSRHTRERMLLSTVQINSVVLTLEGMAAQLRVAQTLGKSATLMKQVRCDPSLDKKA